jgi:threonine/homoserine/homoserine lactone efflux protein
MILPGPDMALVTKQSLGQGWRGGLGTIVGIYLAFLLYSLAIVAGIIPLLNSWPAFFVVARLAGGLYLIYLGLQGIADARSQTDWSVQSSRGLVWSGFVSNALNAKQYLFLFLLLPSFLPSNPTWADSAYLLGLLFVVSLLFWALWICLACVLGQKMRGHHKKIETASSLALVVVGVLLLVGVV